MVALTWHVEACAQTLETGIEASTQTEEAKPELCDTKLEDDQGHASSTEPIDLAWTTLYKNII